jgi:hypothetical protein
MLLHAARIILLLAAFVLANKRVHPNDCHQSILPKRPRHEATPTTSSVSGLSDWSSKTMSWYGPMYPETPSKALPNPSFASQKFVSQNFIIQNSKPLNFDVLHTEASPEFKASVYSSTSQDVALPSDQEKPTISHLSPFKSGKSEAQSVSTEIASAFNMPSSTSDRIPLTSTGIVSSDSNTRVEASRTNRKAYLDKMNMLTLNGKDVAVVLHGRENFFADLPYIECVLPSMMAGESYFVPAFIHKILLPSWFGKRNDKKDAWFDDEQFIISMSKDDFSPALMYYARLLAYACLLEIEVLDEDSVKRSKFPQLSQFMLFYTGIDLSTFVNISPNIDKFLDAYLGKCIGKIPSIIMIGLQWGFDARMIIANLEQFTKRIRHLISSHVHDKLVEFLGMFEKKPVLPTLYPSTVASVYWTTNPVFILKAGRRVGQIVPVKQLLSKTVYVPSSAPDRTKYYEIKQFLIARKHSIADHTSIFLIPKADFVYEREDHSKQEEQPCEAPLPVPRASSSKKLISFAHRFDVDTEDEDEISMNAFLDDSS